MTARQARMLLALAALWGASFLFIRVAVDDLGPVVLADGRLLLAVVGLVAILWLARRPPAARPASAAPYPLLRPLHAPPPLPPIPAAGARPGASLAPHPQPL